jgi:MFS family permease
MILTRRHVVAAVIGNALEFYDFMTYAFFAIQIGRTFFPTQSAYGSLMLSLATFGAGFVTRPLGGIVIGAYSDRAGRRAAMTLSLTMMGCAIVVLALTPSYAAIGLAAPIVVIVARMVQGFSLGGEVGPTTAFLLEAAPAERRGAVVCWQGASQFIASSIGGLVGVILSEVMSPAMLDSYGWRIAFLIGAMALPFGLWIRRRLPETLHEPEESAVAAAAQTVLEAVRRNKRTIVLGLMILAYATIATYFTQYMTTFAQNTLHMPQNVSFAATLVGNIASFGGIVLGGWVSDRLGRRATMIWPSLVFLLLVYPVFSWIVAAHTGFALLTGVAILGFAGQIAVGAFYPALTESLPKRFRGRAVAIIYATSIATFGGTAQLVTTWLIHATGNPLAAAWYLTGATAVGLLAMSLIRESAPRQLARLAKRT